MQPINRVLIEVTDATVEKRRYEKADGSEASYNVQTVYLHVPGKRYAKEFPRRVAKDTAPVPVGWYEQDYGQLWTNYGFNRCEFTLGSLIPVPENQVKAVLSSWQAEGQKAAA